MMSEISALKDPPPRLLQDWKHTERKDNVRALHGWIDSRAEVATCKRNRICKRRRRTYIHSQRSFCFPTFSKKQIPLSRAASKFLLHQNSLQLPNEISFQSNFKSRTVRITRNPISPPNFPTKASILVGNKYPLSSPNLRRQKPAHYLGAVLIGLLFKKLSKSSTT